MEKLCSNNKNQLKFTEFPSLTEKVQQLTKKNKSIKWILRNEQKIFYFKTKKYIYHKRNSLLWDLN